MAKNHQTQKQTKQNMYRLGALILAAMMLLGVVASTIYAIITLH